MPSRIWTAYEVVRAYEPVMRWADVTTLHDLRIAAKWLRYTLEFVREALGRDAGPVIEKVVALQDHLGWLHDADVAANLARALPRGARGRLSEAESAAIGRYLVDRERELARLRRTVGSAVARRGEPRVPARARTGRRGTLATRASARVLDPFRPEPGPYSIGQSSSDQPRTSTAGGRARPGLRPRRAITSPSRIPSSDTRRRSAS